MSESTSSKHFYVGLLTLLICILVVACTPRSTATPALATNVSQVVTAPAPTLYIMPSPPPSPTAVCANAPRGRLILRERGRVLPDDPRPINLRSAAGTDNTVFVQIPIRAVFYVLDGPVCADNFAWYKIRYLGREGWIAEGDLTSYYVEPYLPG